MLEVTNLECIRGDRTLFSGLEFSLESGELLHLQGHNGSGKTSLLRILCGLIAPSQGLVHWKGNNIRWRRDEFAADMLFLGHLNGIKADLTAVENLRILCQLSGLDISDENLWQVLEKMGLYGYEDLPVRVLSQGQKRRVTLARLLLSKVPLWLLDEPFTSLDKAAVDFLQTVIAEHLKDGGMVMLTTHQEVALTTGEVRQLRLGWKRDSDV
ncbi:MAG TPA: cytochrome c biogenesis heme-transporting ATPase CcmA [Gammaproteobacteria bacterium]|nr:cytochrome c biogenesis ATP-binding export protein CcmA [bacterium BMS3Abin11]HDH09020.1 cytochrome c biogenesis heme-transporting ATPase CcmA [Gammaproteobacteria bacterium]HDH15457.1 cytochrome c biogenesis heme-transporting ATPase CcmA [Gammaproteobacteria bacterium]HDZ78940.1 cytochrome c biogenesis heme-transporting ATPase CcmA [Gammaproteobacteria bacterium]